MRLESIHLLALSALFALWSADAHAQTERYALVLGNNHGEPEDVELQFADDDARNFSSVLMRMGDLPEEHLELLINASSTQAEGALERLNKKIARTREESPQAEVLLTIYYSGHADRTSLHMGGTHMRFERLKALLEESPADLKVLIVDACSSGELTRVKGAKPAPSFELSALEKNTSQGLAIITSATSGENAQESDRLSGSFFTHHLLAGLLGAADSSDDQQVTLTEAYQYAYRETLRATSRLPSIQHPTYSFALRGRRDVVLTRLHAKHRAYGYLKLKPAGRFVIFRDGAQGELVAEFSTGKPTRLILKEGSYFVRWRDEDVIREASFAIAGGQKTTSLDGDDFERVPYAQVVRKGSVDMTHQPSSSSVAAIVRGGFQRSILSGASPARSLYAGLQLDRPMFSGQLGLRIGSNEHENNVLTITHRSIGAEVTGARAWDVRRWTLSLGAGAGFDRITQTFQTEGYAPPRASITGFVGGRATMSVAILPRVSLIALGSVDLVFSRQRDAIDDQETLGYTLLPAAQAGVSVSLY